MDISKKKKVGAVAAVSAGAVGLLGFALFGMPGRAQSEPSQKDMRIDKAIREEAIAGVIANLEKSYVFPDKAAVLTKQLRARMQRGDYDTVTSAEKLAETLTADLRRDSQDKHLEVRYFEKAVAQPSPEQEASDAAAEFIDGQRFNFGFKRLERLNGNIAYLNLHSFSRPNGASERIAAAMTLFGDTKAMVIDLRDCYGGDPETVMLFASYLFDQPTHLNDLYWRDENRTEQRWTTATVPGKKYGSTRKVYLLTSSDTISGCEDFAYALKNAGRATVIGETTGGGAHAGGPRRLSDHFMMFVPSGRPINPVTHTDWEGVGVKPDIAAPAEKALEVAEISALKDLIATETDQDWKQRLQLRLDEIE
ncbi:S41 family peptidase [Lysobacter tyrosinilyticus]